MRNIPEAFLKRMRALPDWDEAAFEQALTSGEPRRGLRVNTLKIDTAEFAANSPFTLEPSALCPDGFLIEAEAAAGTHPYHAAGLYYLQEPSAQAVVTAAELKPGMRVLDLCAAPGGKSGHAAAQLAHTGLLIANECVASRAKVLTFNQERMGVRAGAVTSAMPEAIVEAAEGYFDAVLADVPCSGEGMFRREPRAVEEWSPEHADTCAVRGRKILADAARLVRPGGILMFSTCTFNPDENEGAIEALLCENPEFEVEEITAVKLPEGRPDWAGAREELRKSARLMFYNAQGEGHFIARLRRKDGEEVAEPASANFTALSRDGMAAFRTFWEDTFTIAPWYEPRMRGDEVFLVPENLPNLPGMMSPGVHAGTLVKERKGMRFEPSHTLFLTVPARDIRRVCTMEADDPALEAYFGGAPVPTEVPNGYAAAAVRCGENAYPVGFGKISGGILKNKLPKGLRK